MPYFWQMKAACVPLPAPGAPNKISLMVSSDRFLNFCALRAGARGARAGALRPRIARASVQMAARTGGGSAAAKRARTRARSSGVSTPGPGACVAHMHRDAVAVPQGAQLLQRLDGLDRRRRQRREMPQEAGAVAVDADVAQRRRLGGSASVPPCAKPSRHQGIGARLKYSALPLASSTAFTTFGLRKSAGLSIACAAVLIAASGRSASSVGHRVDQRRVDQRLVALHVDHDGVVGQRRAASQASASRSLPLAWSSRVSTASTPWRAAGVRRCARRRRRPRRARRRDCAARWATRTTIGRPAMSASGLSGRRVEASRAGIRTVKPGTMRGAGAELFVGQRARFFLEQHRDAVADRVGEPGAARDELLLARRPVQRPLGHGADEQFKQLGVHRAMIALRRAAAKKAGLGRRTPAARPNASGARRHSLTASFSVHSNVCAAPAGGAGRRNRGGRAGRCSARASRPRARSMAKKRLGLGDAGDRDHAAGRARAAERDRARRRRARRDRPAPLGRGTRAKAGCRAGVQHQVARGAAKARAAGRPAAASRCRCRARRTRRSPGRAPAHGAAGHRR